MITAELRIGNLLNYHTAEGEVLPTVIDWQDLKWISEDPKGFNLVHSPIPITEEILLKCGFQVVNQNSAGKKYSFVVDGVFSEDFNLVFWKTIKNFGKIYRGNLEIKYVHQLQNLIYALTGEELTVNF